MLDVTHPLDRASLGQRRERRQKPVEYRLYYAIVLAVALPIALAGRLFPRRLAVHPAAPEERRSVLAEARALTNTVIPYLFMG